MDKSEIRNMLKNSLDMVNIRSWLVIAGLCLLIEGIWVLLFGHPYGAEALMIFGTMAAITLIPILGFCICRTVSIFRCAESYHFSKTILNNPKGGRIRDTIRFAVLAEDSEGCKFPVTTHSIFHTHRSSMGLALEDYINREVTVGYNEETGEIVVIG